MDTSSQKLDLSIILVVIIGTFMAILDGTIVNVGLPRIINVYNSSADHAQWIVTSYMLVLGIVMPLSGYLGDRFGYKKMYFYALGVFVFGSTLCGAAWSIDSLIVSRIVQAVGGGIMQPLGMAILYQNYPREKMGMVMGLWGISVMAAPAVGPTLGGYLVDYVNWRFIFYINVPLGILNMFLAAFILKETPLLESRDFDFKGLVSSMIGFFCLLFALSKANQYGWDSPIIVGLLFISLLSLSFFVVNELNHPEPILDLRLFKNYIFALAVIISSIISIGMYSVIFLIPLLLQSVLGQTAMQTGWILFPAALTSGCMMPISGRLFDKYGPRVIVTGGLFIVTWATYVISTFNALTAFSIMALWIAIRGLGMGFCFMPTTTAGMNTVPPHLVGRASALNNVIRQIASAFGIAVFTTVFQTRQVFHFSNLAYSANLNSAEYMTLLNKLQAVAGNLGLGYGDIQGMTTGMVSSRIAKQSMVYAMNDCFAVATLICLVGLVLAFFLKSKKAAAIEDELKDISA